MIAGFQIRVMHSYRCTKVRRLSDHLRIHERRTLDYHSQRKIYLSANTKHLNYI